MHTSSLLVSFLVSGFAAAATKSYSTPVDCPPLVAASTSRVYGPPDYTASTTLIVQHTSSSLASYGGPKEYNSHSAHGTTFTKLGGPDCTTSRHPPTPTVMTSTKSYETGSTTVHKESHSLPWGGIRTSSTPAAYPTYPAVQSVANHINGQGLLIATVAAGLCLFL